MKNLIRLVRKEDSELYVLVTGEKVKSLEKTEFIVHSFSSLEDKQIESEIFELSTSYKKMNSYEMSKPNSTNFDIDYFFITFHKIENKYVKRASKY